MQKLIKRSLKVTIDDIEGTYYGWHNLQSYNTPKGYGILVSDAKVIIGYTEDGEWKLSRPQIIISKTENEVQVSVPKLARLGGHQIGTTKSFYILNGPTRFEVHFDDGTVLELKVQNKASDSFGKNCKYTTNRKRYGFGEHNEANELHGKGIEINSFNGSIHIGYYNNGDDAPGNFIYIYYDGDVNVGEWYMKDGKKCYRGTEYRTDGTTKEFGY